MRKIALLGAVLAAALAAPAAHAANNVTVGHSSWFWGNPQPQGNTLNAVDFAGGTGYVAGDFGTLLKTTDNGSTFTGIATGITADLSQVRALDANTVFVGAGCLLRRSDDGGATFKRILAVPSERRCPAGVTSFYFVNGQTGYVLLADGTIERTDDGGQSFAQRTAVPGTAATKVPNPADAADIWFTAADTGYAMAGGIIYRTTDGAGSWTRVSGGPHTLHSFFFSDATTGYAVGADNTVIKTTDGLVWNDKPVGGGIPDLDLTKIDCSPGGASRCLLATRQGDQLLRTDDGGDSFTAVTASTSKIFAAGFSTDQDALAVGQAGATAISASGGTNWAPVGSVLTATLSRLRATSSSAVYATGDNGSLARTVNGGQDWTKPNVSTSEDVRDVSFPSADVGYAVDTAGDVRKTIDAGGHWTPLDIGGEQGPLSLLAPDPSTVLLVLPTGLAHSTDGGSSFDPIASKAVRKAHFQDVDQTTGGLVFYGPKALVTSDAAGTKFTALKRPDKGSQIVKADFITRQAGYVLAGDGRLWVTNNGGKRWSELRATGTSGIYDMAWGDAHSGWLAIRDFGGDAQSGYLLRTSDGGRSWRPQLVAPSPIHVRGLVATAGTTAFALADGNQLFYTSAGGDQGQASALTLSSNRKTVGRKGGTVTLAGKLAPAVAGADVFVKVRGANGGHWTTYLPRPTSGGGTFTLKIKVKRPVIIEAQWLGDADHNGDGSNLISVGQTKPKKKATKKGK
jgi:photosystem II stability/assembly factor-like uncharacterized protein